MIYRFGECELDTRLYELRRSGQRVPIEPQVFDVLAYLVENHDRLVTRQEILDHVWPEHFVTEAVLSTRLMAVRRAIGDSGRTQRFIQTVHGRGFRFLAEIGAQEDREPTVATGSLNPTLEPGPPRHPSTTSPHSPSTQSKDPIVGRDALLTQMHAKAARVLHGERQILFLTGEGGIGKTTLIREFLRQTETGNQWWTGVGQCIEHYGAGEPYMPVFDILTQLCRQSSGPDAVAVLSRHAPTWLLQLPWLLDSADTELLRLRTVGATPERMLRELTTAVQELAAMRPLLFVLEDLHWSDYSTVNFINLLARGQDPARILLIGTYRPADLRSADHPLYAVERELSARGKSSQMAITPLRIPDIARYLSVSLPERQNPEALAHFVYGRTDGNPLFMRSVVEHWLDQRLLDDEDASSGSQLMRTIPASLQALIERDFERVSAPDRPLLEVLAVSGRELSADAIAALLAESVDDTEERCERLCRHGQFLKYVDPDESQRRDTSAERLYGLFHGLHLEVLYGLIPPAKRQGLHARVGEYLETIQMTGDATAAELALHFRRGRDPMRAVRYLQQAGEQALERNAYHEAREHLLAGLEEVRRIEDARERTHRELVLQAMLGPTLTVTHGWADTEVERAFTRARELAHELGDVRRLSPVLYGLATMHELRGEFDKTQSVLSERALLLSQASGSGPVVESEELMACSTFHQGKFEESVRHAEIGLSLYNPADHLALSAFLGENPCVSCHHWSALALWFLGYPDKALTTIRSALELAETTTHWFSLAHAQEQAACLHQHRGEIDQTEMRAKATIALAERMGSPYRVATGSILLGWTRAMADNTTGITEIHSGLSVCRTAGARIDLPYYLGLLADACLRTGDVEGGLAAISEGLDAVERGRGYFYEAELTRLKGELLLREDQGHHSSDAEGCFREAIAVANRQKSNSLALRAATSLASLLRRRGDHTEALLTLAPIYDTFDEGHATADLRRASTLLTEMNAAVERQ